MNAELTQRIRVEKMLDGINDGCVSLDAEWRFTHVNEAAARLLGKPAAELLGKIYWKEFPTMLEGHLEQACKCAMAEQMTVEFDDVFLPGDRWLEVKAYPISPGEMCLCFRDITEQKHTAKASATLRRDLETQVEDLRQLHELSGRRSPAREPEPMLQEVLRAALMVDGADMGLLSLADPQREGLGTGVSSGFGPEFLQISEFIPPGAGACGVCYQQRQLVVIEDVEQDPRFVRYRETAKVGGFRAVHCTPLTTRENRVIGVLSIYFRRPHRPSEREIRLIDLYARQAADCIENARLLGEITMARDAAEQASKSKDDFLVALSHELRAPLNPALLLASEGAGNPDLPAEIREDFSSIARSVSLEARLIDDLLDLTGISHGRRASEMRALDVHHILQEALVTVRPEFVRKRIALTLSLRATQHTIMGDPVRLQQIFWNVFNNAAKFTPEKGVVCIETRTIASKGVVAMKIIDTGIGMTATELGTVFNAFAHGHPSDRVTSPRAGGRGIGLAHSRLLVELHGGRIRAFSAGRDQGATLVVELPLARAETMARGSLSSFSAAGKPPVNARLDAAGRRCRILLVEDHEPTRIALAQLLVRRRYDVSTAGSVAEAIALAEKKDFDLLVADIGLPDADGYELMITLRERHGLKGVAVTGYGMEQDIARSKAAGFVAHLTKPVSAQAFEHALAAASAG